MTEVRKIRRCRDLAAVSRLVARQRQHALAMKMLRSTKTHEEHFLLSAPATAALAIDAENLTWPPDRPLNLLIIGARSKEILDRGQWFRFVAPMLEESGDVTVTVCGFDRSALLKSTVPDAVRNGQIPVFFHQRGVQKILNHLETPIDLAIVFSPIQASPTLLADLAALGEHNVPLYFSSYSSLHALLQHTLLRAHHAEAEAVVVRSPFELVSTRPGEHWHRVLSRVVHFPSAKDELDKDYLGLLNVVTTMVLHSHRIGEPSQTWSVGTKIEGGWLHTLDGVFVNDKTFLVRDGNTTEELGLLDAQVHEHVTDFDPEWDEVDRLIWAAHVRYLAMSGGLLTHADRSLMADQAGVN